MAHGLASRAAGNRDRACGRQSGRAAAHAQCAVMAAFAGFHIRTRPAARTSRPAAARRRRCPSVRWAASTGQRKAPRDHDGWTLPGSRQAGPVLLDQAASHARSIPSCVPSTVHTSFRRSTVPPGDGPTARQTFTIASTFPATTPRVRDSRRPCIETAGSALDMHRLRNTGVLGDTERKCATGLSEHTLCRRHDTSPRWPRSEHFENPLQGGGAVGSEDPWPAPPPSLPKAALARGDADAHARRSPYRRRHCRRPNNTSTWSRVRRRDRFPPADDARTVSCRVDDMPRSPYARTDGQSADRGPQRPGSTTPNDKGSARSRARYAPGG